MDHTHVSQILGGYGLPVCQSATYRYLWNSTVLCKSLKKRTIGEHRNYPIRCKPCQVTNYQGIGAAQSMKAGRARKKKDRISTAKSRITNSPELVAQRFSEL